MDIMNNAGELNTAEKGFSRRNFLMGAASAGALAVLGLSGCAPKGKDELSDTGASATGADVNWDEETEALVVGSGYAGLAAAYEAAKAGAAVRVIEKHKMAGGNSVYADGQITVVGSAAQKAAGIEDSIETFMNDALTAGLNLNYKDKLQLVGEKSNEVFEWTVSEIGVEWAQDEATVAEGCSDFDPDTASSTTNVKTTRGVVLATGGYGKDVTFRSAQDPRLDETVGCTNFDGATAHGLRVALNAGVMGMQLDQIQCYPYTSPEEDSFGCAATWIEAGSAYAPTIDPTTGKRFVNELTDRKRFCDAMFEAGTPLVQIGSVDNVPDWCAESLENALSAGEATGGVHGACRLGCNGTLDCLVNGRIAGQQVAALEPVA